MNGKMYDPILGRMLSTDPYVQAPEYTQSYNRYSYCWNNPLKYTDPTGMGVNDVNELDEVVVYGNRSNNWRTTSSFELGFRMYVDENYFMQREWDLFRTQQLAGLKLLKSATLGKLPLPPIAPVTIPTPMPIFPQLTLPAGSIAVKCDVIINVLNGIQVGLDIVGLVPGIGEFFDLGNAGIYVLRGDYLNAGLSATACIPFVGWASTGGKLGGKVAAKGGVEISQHAAQRMAERGISTKMVETGISKGAKYFDPLNGTFNYVLKDGFASGKDLLIGVSPQTGKVTTVLRGNDLINKRFISQ
jgi:hypothetical protein